METPRIAGRFVLVNELINLKDVFTLLRRFLEIVVACSFGAREAVDDP